MKKKLAHLELAKKIVKSWPKWKQNINTRPMTNRGIRNDT